MKRLCFGSYISVLVQCKARSVTQKQLIGEMLSTINKNYDICEDDGATAALARGKNNLSQDIILFLDDVSDNLSSKFSTIVIPLLDANKRVNIVLAFKDILREDTEIADDTEVELLNHLTKADIMKRESFVFCDLLAGMFLYVAKYTDNHDKKECIKEITDSYIQSIDDHSTPITFIESYSLENLKQLQKTVADARVMKLMAEQAGNCLMCGKPLTVDNCNLAKLADNAEMLLCVECSVSVEHSAKLKEQALALKASLQRQYETRSMVYDNKLIAEVHELLKRMQNMTSEDITLRYTPLSIEKKVSDHLLQRKIRGYIVGGMYDAVNSCIENLAAENRLSVRRLAKCIHRTFEDANETTTCQSEIFNVLSKFIFTQTGQQYFEACELLVSYFVQRCEVFNEIAE